MSCEEWIKEIETLPYSEYGYYFSDEKFTAMLFDWKEDRENLLKEIELLNNRLRYAKEKAFLE